MGKILEGIKDASDVRKLSISALPALASEIREEIIRTVSRTGGHLAPSLGTVEIAIALHYVFNTPSDAVIWEMSYPSRCNASSPIRWIFPRRNVR